MSQILTFTKRREREMSEYYFYNPHIQGRISFSDLHADDIITTFMREMNMLEITGESYTAINTPRTLGRWGLHFLMHDDIYSDEHLVLATPGSP